MFISGCNPCSSPCTKSSCNVPTNKAHGKANAKQKLLSKKPSWVNCGPCTTPISASRRYELKEGPVTPESCLLKCGKCGRWVPFAKCRDCGKFELVGRCDANEEVPRSKNIPKAAISEEVLQKCKICGQFGTNCQCDPSDQLNSCDVCRSVDNKCRLCGACTWCSSCSQYGLCGQCGACSHCPLCGQFGWCSQYGPYCTSQNVFHGQCDPWHLCIQCAKFANGSRFVPCLTNCSYCSPQNPRNQLCSCQQCVTDANFALNGQFGQSAQYVPCVPYGSCVTCGSFNLRAPVNHYGQLGEHNQAVSPGLSIPTCPTVSHPHPGTPTQPSCPPPNLSTPCDSNNTSSSDVPLATNICKNPCNTIPVNKNTVCFSKFKEPQCSPSPPVITIYAHRTYLDTSGSFQ